MSELKEHLFVPYSELQQGDELTDAITIAKSYYLKSEVDKVIAKLENENERLKKQSSCTFSDDCLRVRQLRADYKEACDRLQTANLIKSEVDKVIAELKAKLKVQTSNAEEAWKLKDSYHTDYSEAVEELFKKNKQLRHNKYKRCLAMAKWCEATSLWCYQAANTLPAGIHATLHGKPVMIEPARLFKRSALLTKWETRWLELADKFKDKEA